MSFFKKLVKGVIIGAVVGLTGGAALIALGSSITAAMGIQATGWALAKAALIRGAIYGGLQGAAAGFAKKPNMDMGDVTDRHNIRVDPQATGKWIFGETIAASDIVYTEKVEEVAIVHVIAAACHEIDSYGDLYLNDKLVTIVDNWQATGDYLNVLAVYRNLGTLTQNALNIDDSIWPSTAKGTGIAHYAFRWNYTSEQAKKMLSGGIPTRVTQVVKGCKVYDPRKDSTNGGTGLHRVNDEATWEWSDNWALIVAHYLVGHKLNGDLVYGVGTDPANIVWDQVIAMANVCDEVVDGKPKYRIGGMFQITQKHEEIIGQLEAAIGGKVSKFGGKYYIWAPHNDLTPTGTLTDDFIVAEGGINFIPSGPIENLYNSAYGQYVSPADLYQPVSYPEITETTAIVEDGKRRLLDQNFSIIQDKEIAQRVAREMVRRSRFTATIKVVCSPAALIVRPFDVVNVNFRETNYTNELFRVISMQYSAAGAIVVELMEEDASIYDVSLPLGPSVAQLDPSAYDPTQAIELTGLTLTNISAPGVGGEATDGIFVQWDDPGGFVDYTEGGYRLGDDPEWVYVRSSELTSGTITPVEPYTLYELRARHVTLEGVVGEWKYASIITANSTYDRITAIGVSAPDDPKIWVTPNRQKGTADIRIATSYAQSLSVVPDTFMLFYSVREIPNAFPITNDTGDKLYIDVASILAGEFETTAASGGTLTSLRYNTLPGLDIDLSGMWWASLRDGTPTFYPYFKITEATPTTMYFEADKQLPFAPVAGNPIKVVEVDYADSRVTEFRLLWANGETIRHNGVRQDGSGYYLEVVERGTEGTAQANQTGQMGHYFPATGALTNTLTIDVADFKKVNGEFIYSSEIPLLLPAQIGWASVTCCLARKVEDMGEYEYVRSNIIPLTIVGAV